MFDPFATKRYPIKAIQPIIQNSGMWAGIPAHLIMFDEPCSAPFCKSCKTPALLSDSDILDRMRDNEKEYGGAQIPRVRVMGADSYREPLYSLTNNLSRFSYHTILETSGNNSFRADDRFDHVCLTIDFRAELPLKLITRAAHEIIATLATPADVDLLEHLLIAYQPLDIESDQIWLQPADFHITAQLELCVLAAVQHGWNVSPHALRVNVPDKIVLSATTMQAAQQPEKSVLRISVDGVDYHMKATDAEEWR